MRGKLAGSAAALAALALVAVWAAEAQQPGGTIGLKKGPPIVGLKTLAPRLPRLPVKNLPQLTSRQREANPGRGLPIGNKGRRRGAPKLKATQERQRRAAGGSASTDFEIFRDTEVYDGAATSDTGEPSAGNDRNVILYTGNWHTHVSTDNGLTWEALDPQDTSALPRVDGGFCCDQLVNASDEDGNELIAWLLQYSNDGTDNTIRIATYRGRDDVELHLEQQASGTPVSALCIYDFQPSDFDLPSNRQLDFNVMENSDEWLYVSSNVHKISDGNSVGYVVWRIKLDDLTDSDCTLESGFQYLFDDTYWSARLVEGAGSTMWWAALKDTNTIRLYWVSDSSTDVDAANKSVTTFTTGGSSSCPYAGEDACKDLKNKIYAGWRTGSEVGWLWHSAQDSDYDYPHIVGARFRTSDRDLLGEIDIWNSDYAWAYPSTGVNARGDVGIVLYRLGGNTHPRVRAFAVDDVTPSWSSITVTAVSTSSFSPADDEWGDYGDVSRYDGCSNTWLGTGFTMKDGEQDGDAAHQIVWFGRERDACPDLRIKSVTASLSGSGRISISDTTENTGIGSAATSITRYYLSRDQEQSTGDTLLGVSHTVPTLAAEDSTTVGTSASAPTDKGGSFYVIACADDTDVVDEITDTNNCLPTDGTVDLPIRIRTFVPQDLLVFASVRGVTSASPGSKFTVPVTIRQYGPKRGPDKATLSAYLSLLQVVDRDRIRLATQPVTEWKPIPVPPPQIPKPTPENPRPLRPFAFEARVTLSATVPQRIALGRYYLVVCISNANERADEIIAGNDCRASKTRVLVRSAG